MKQADMNPMTGRAWRCGQSVKVGAWSFHDLVSLDGAFPVRYVYHYSTLMFTFDSVYDVPFVGSGWDVNPYSVGYGSVSDQHGCNRIIGSMSAAYYSRKGGAEWVTRAKQ